MWRPGFAHDASYPARVFGRHRRLCVYSNWHRGTDDWPGLVMGLDRGGSCVGRVFQVSAADWPAAVAYLDARELLTEIYRPLDMRALTPQGWVTARTYVVNHLHEQYAGQLPAERQADIIRHAVGNSGANPDYLHSTVQHLKELGIRDRALEDVWQKLFG